MKKSHVPLCALLGALILLGACATAPGKDVQKGWAVPGSRATIHAKAMDWFAANAARYQLSVQSQDAEKGRILGMGFTGITVDNRSCTLQFGITVESGAGQVAVKYSSVAVFDPPESTDISARVPAAPISNALDMVSTSLLDFLAR